jgi:hypothetical protein
MNRLGFEWPPAPNIIIDFIIKSNWFQEIPGKYLSKIFLFTAAGIDKGALHLQPLPPLVENPGLQAGNPELQFYP